jgi:hypothetical protein
MHFLVYRAMSCPAGFLPPSRAPARLVYKKVIPYLESARLHVNVNLDGLGDVLRITDITGQWWIRTELLA